ncbi:MAG: hypothetical protein WC313_02745 [Candidatus Kapaibacterium sp.]|jgi:cell division septal protein FtsQ|nr:hypothetical protein [Candidatus Kapabacteria bacterium]
MTDTENVNEIKETVSKRSNSKRPWLIVLLFFALIGFVVLSVISDKWRENRSISAIKVYGSKMSSADNIIDSISNLVLKKYIKDINTNDLSDIIKRNVYVEDVRIVPLFNGECQIFISERIPVALSVNHGGSLIFADREGHVFPYQPDIASVDLPVLRGIVGSSSYSEASNLLSRIVDECPEYTGIISEIMPGRGHNTFEIITSDYGYRIIIDSNTSLSDQLSKYYIFLGSSICGNEKINIDYLDLRWEKRLVVGKQT